MSHICPIIISLLLVPKLTLGLDPTRSSLLTVGPWSFNTCMSLAERSRFTFGGTLFTLWSKPVPPPSCSFHNSCPLCCTCHQGTWAQQAAQWSIQQVAGQSLYLCKELAMHTAWTQEAPVTDLLKVANQLPLIIRCPMFIPNATWWKPMLLPSIIHLLTTERHCFYC